MMGYCVYYNGEVNVTPPLTEEHRAARALRDRKDFFAVVLNEAETLELLRRSIGAGVADYHWRRMADSKPHPDDAPQGEPR
jgi:hypothetical protein